MCKRIEDLSVSICPVVKQAIERYSATLPFNPKPSRIGNALICHSLDRVQHGLVTIPQLDEQFAWNHPEARGAGGNAVDGYLMSEYMKASGLSRLEAERELIRLGLLIQRRCNFGFKLESSATDIVASIATAEKAG